MVSPNLIIINFRSQVLSFPEWCVNPNIETFCFLIGWPFKTRLIFIHWVNLTFKVCFGVFFSKVLTQFCFHFLKLRGKMVFRLCNILFPKQIYRVIPVLCIFFLSSIVHSSKMCSYFAERASSLLGSTIAYPSYSAMVRYTIYSAGPRT